MSVKLIKQEPKSPYGKLQITCGQERMGADEYLVRIRSLIRLVKCQNDDMLSIDDIYYILDLIEDMLPDEEQAEKMFG